MADNGRWSSWISGSEKPDTLPEHYSALALLQQLDHTWFHDNLLKPRVGLIDAFLPSPPRLSPYQSIELTKATHSTLSASLLSQHSRSGKMPCARFEPMSLTQTRVSPAISKNVPSEGRQNVSKPDHQPHRLPPSSDGLFSQQNVLSNRLTDSILVPLTTTQAWVAMDIRHLKDCEVNEGIKAWNIRPVEPRKQLRVSMVERQLPLQPTLRVAGPKRMRRTNSRSMTALEFDELQGFMDLGFHVSHDDLTPRIQWQAPATREDMKEHLKFWARAVASTVRQEC